MKILLNGACGKMGKSIIDLVKRDYNSIKIIPVDIVKMENVFEISDVKDFDCVVDFSSRDGFEQSLSYAVSFSKPFISGTTGLSEENKKNMLEASQKIAVFYSPNMSIGVNICFYLADLISRRIKADVYINEIHHTAKKDKPSGTAIKFKEIIESNGLKVDISGVRAGDVVGEHEVGFIMNGERIKISHIALTREIFARGAISAAIWVCDKEKGLYSFNDMLKFIK